MQCDQYLCNYCFTSCAIRRKRTTFKPDELATTFVSLKEQKRVDGLFLSSGIIRSPDYTMEQIVRVAQSLREDHGFKGYIHLKTIPDADPELVHQAGLYADRISINVELPTAAGLTRLAAQEWELIVGWLVGFEGTIGEMTTFEADEPSPVLPTLPT